MPVIRNPFRRTAPATPFSTSSDSVITENLSQSTVSLADSGKLSVTEDAHPVTSRSKSGSAISIPKHQDEGYKLSVESQSYPSPPEKKSFWKKSESSSNSSKVKTPVLEEEQFVIPRESFESYRRSFDISARSPISDIAPSRGSFDSRTRTSLDVRPNARASLDVRPPRASLDVQPSRLSLDQRPMRRGPNFSKGLDGPSEDAFEDVKLNDDARPKKRSIFSRFGADHTAVDNKNGLFSKKDMPAETVLESELKPIAGKE